MGWAVHVTHHALMRWRERYANEGTDDEIAELIRKRAQAGLPVSRSTVRKRGSEFCGEFKVLLGDCTLTCVREGLRVTVVTVW